MTIFLKDTWIWFCKFNKCASFCVHR